MGTTAKYAWPYPEQTSAVDVALDVKKLADAVDASLDAAAGDTGWVNVTIASGFAGQSTEPPQVRKIGKVVYLRGGWLNTGIAANASPNVGTVPAGFRPPLPSVAQAGSSAGTVIGHLHVLPDGTVQLRAGATVGAYYKWDRQSYPID